MSTAAYARTCITLLFVATATAFCQQQPGQPTVPLDVARIDSGTTVVAISEGCNPPPYDVAGALGEGAHCSFPQAPPNWFILDLGTTRSIHAIEIDWRYTDKSADDVTIRFGDSVDALDTVIDIRGIGGQGKYWYRVLEQPIAARFVKLEVLSLKHIEWTVLNRFSLYESSRIPRLVEVHTLRYADLAERVERLLDQAGANQLVTPGWIARLHRDVTRHHRQLSGSGPITDAEWRTMETDYPHVLQSAYDAEAAISFQIARRTRGDGPVWVAALDNMSRAFRDIWPAAARSELALACARNEWESGQIIVAAPDLPLRQVRVSWQPLQGPITLAPDALDVQLVAYLKTEASPTMTHHIGWWPDGLCPLAPWDLPARSVQPLWVTAKIPADAPPGTYHSRIAIRTDSGVHREIPLTVTVWDFTLPTEIALPNIFSLSSQLVEAWYRRDALTWDQLKYAYYDFWLERRLNPTSLYGTKQPPPEDLDYCLERGMNTFVLEYIYNKNVLEEEAFQRLLGRLAEWDPILREKNLYDKALVYLADEPAEKPAVTAEINRRADVIRERFPQMQRFLVLTRPIDPAFSGRVEAWCPIVSAMRPEDAAEVQARGERCWWYTVGNFYGLDRPLAESRSMPWLTWKHNLDGILLWVIQSGWRGKNKPARFSPSPGETLWPTFVVAGHGGHNGIGNLCYPGVEGKPWSSVRLEVLRESMEDYEYLHLLRTTLEQHPDKTYESLLTVPEDIAVEYPVGADGAAMLEHRRRLGEALHALRPDSRPATGETP